jgi:hypothetical protein
MDCSSPDFVFALDGHAGHGRRTGDYGSWSWRGTRHNHGCTRPAVQTPFAAASPSPAPEPIWEDAGAIETGVTYEELIRRFGPYSMAISDSTQKMLTYRGKTGIFQVTLQDGKVAAIEKPPAPRESR